MKRGVVSFFVDSIKGRIIVNVAIIHAVMIGVVVYDISTHQKDFMHREQTKKGVELSSMLASNTADAMLRNDIVAMDEMLSELTSVKNANMVFLLDASGRVRASSDKSYFNTFLNDETSVRLLKDALNSKTGVSQSVHNHLVDTLYPVQIRGKTIGFTRIILDNSELENEVDDIIKSGIAYALLAIFSGSLLAFFTIRRMSKDIDALSQAAKRIANKDFETPVPTIKGKSEIANMAKAFAVMAESINKNISELKKSEEQMKWQATHDALTGLNNRVGFEKAIAALMDESRELHTTHALLFLDLDKFKVVNDTAGHLAGDELLRAIAKLMQRSIRQNDLLFRFGGDEFGILLKDCDIAHASSIGQKLIDTVDSYEFRWEGSVFRVGLSIGVVTIDDKSKSAVDVLSLADTACYMAKDKGRNRIFLADQDNEDAMSCRAEMNWIAKIEDALKNKKFELYVQKIEGLKKDSGLHYEVLLRLNEQNGEVVLPGSFIPAAERYMLMSSIDLWVIESLLEYIAQNELILDDTCFSVNLSGQSINDDSFLPKLKEILKPYGHYGKNIIFEITESVAIANHEEANAFISHMREFDCRFALDDFGTGSSSFSYLKNLAVDYLKIDGSFVKNIFDDAVDEVFVEAVTKIANKSNIKVVAEYVEDNNIKEKMESMGVHYAQGFGIEKPFALRLLDTSRFRP